ncbi:PilZ domain-containing protein [Synechococcus sp. BA-132 BA5]|uniref:PilZ domain-containing protein n=1 Tax=Synechococcus sp. BA-132 BA5 TaxID=3110252 RepID=UPI002B20C12A|nr:PilZ domain-containing protein [Synechococcus sp. BA-132 BA5]MEA5417070.1 PilZ domain-containing protein [Synechococcus sp. BA-132 BA5]
MPEDRPENAPDGDGQNSENDNDARQSLRHALPPGVSASLRTHSGRLAYVTVTDLSRSGACVIRRGGIEFDQQEHVILDFSDAELNKELAIPSQVQWVREKNYNTEIGLLFLNGPLLPGTMLDEYLDKPLALRDGF